jgi:hypothetical protein
VVRATGPTTVGGETTDRKLVMDSHKSVLGCRKDQSADVLESKSCGYASSQPYSLRQTAEGYFVLHAIRSDSGDHRSYRVDRMQGAAVTSQVFAPSYAVELTSTGPLTIAPSTATQGLPRIRATARTRHQGPTYVYRCTVCGRTFNKKRMDGSLNPHKNRQGSPCYGRYGAYVRTKY